MNVLSLFDGMSCAQIALSRAGIKYDKYFASEVHKPAIKVTQHNFPNTIQLGDVRMVDASKLPLINLLCGGSPCQSFSFAGKMKGMSTKCDKEVTTLEQYLELKDQNFEFEGQSYLFWEYMRILTDLKKMNPDVKFLLENVEMDKRWEGVLTRAIGINPVVINSALVSAQNRVRLYWTNVNVVQDGFFGEPRSYIPQPKDRGLILKDILESDVDKKYFLSDAALARIFRKNYSDPKYMPERTGTLNTINNSAKQSFDSGTILVGTIDHNRFREIGDKSLCLDANYHKGQDNHGARTVVKYTDNYFQYDLEGKGNASQDQCAYYEDSKMGSLDTSCGSKQKVLLRESIYIPEATKKGYTEIKPGECFDFENPKSKTRRGRKMVDKSNTLMANKTDFMLYAADPSVKTEESIRRLTPVECCRLQTVPDDYFYDKEGNPVISDTQMYHCMGNGWTVDVIVHIFSFLR